MAAVVRGGFATNREDIAWGEIRRQWREREYTALGDAVSGLDGVAVKDVDDLLFALDAPTRDTARAVLQDAFAAAASSQDGPLLLALYVHGRCLEKWERTEDYGRIRDVLDALGDAAGSAPSSGPWGAVGAELVPIVVDHAKLIVEEMSVEDAMSCSCPIAVSQRAHGIVTSLDALLARERALEPGFAEARNVVQADAGTARFHFQAVHEIAESVRSFLDEQVPARTRCFDQILSDLNKALDSDAYDGDVYASELKAQATALEALRDHSAAPRLRVDEADIVYLYPFALDGIGAAEAVGRALAGDTDKAFVSLGLGTVSARQLSLNDLWVREDTTEEGYSGATIELPRIMVETTGGDRLEFTSEVRLSRLGNHVLRVASALPDLADLHTLNQALRRGSHAMGEEKHTTGVSESKETKKTKFPYYAEQVTRAIAVALDAEVITEPSADSHVVVAARSISVVGSDGTSSSAGLPELRQAVGWTLLFHPVRHLATALEEWIRYPPPGVTNLVSQEAYVGDFVVRTDNTTVSLMPASPEWLVGEYEEMIEFVASLPSLLELWKRQAGKRAKNLDGSLGASTSASIADLHDQEATNLELEQDIRRRLAFLHSPMLCRTRGQRRFLDALWESAGLTLAESDVERRLTQLGDRQERIAALVRQKEQEDGELRRERDESFSRRVEVVLGVLAAASLAGVIQWADDAFGARARVWAWLGAGLLAALFFLIIAYIVGLDRRSGRRRSA